MFEPLADPVTDNLAPEEAGSEFSDYSDDEYGSPTNSLSLVSATQSTISLTARLVINLFLPFVNGMMLGFGEIFAHELGFHWGWAGARTYRPATRSRVPVYDKRVD